MKTLLYVIKSLIQINFVIAVISILFVMAVRERKPETGFTSQPSTPPDTFRHEIKENLSDDQREILIYRQKIQQYEQALKQQKAELEHYKAQEPTQSPQLKQSSTFTNAQPIEKQTRTIFNNVNSSVKNQTPIASANLSLPNSQQTEARSMAAFNNINPVNIFEKTQIMPMSFAIPKTPSFNLPSLQTTEQSSSLSPSATSGTSQVVDILPASANSRLLIDPTEAKRHPILVPSATNHFDFSFQLLRPDFPKALPNSQKIAIQTVNLTTASADTPKTAPVPANHLANDITIGLLIAGRKGHINYGTRTYRQVQTAIRSLRNRKSNDIDEAARLAELSPDLLNRLAKSGKDRPGNLENSPISLGIQP